MLIAHETIVNNINITTIKLKGHILIFSFFTKLSLKIYRSNRFIVLVSTNPNNKMTKTKRYMLTLSMCCRTDEEKVIPPTNARITAAKSQE